MTNMLNDDGSNKSEIQLWFEEANEKGISMDTLLNQLREELEATDDPEDVEFLTHSIRVIEIAIHS